MNNKAATDLIPPDKRVGDAVYFKALTWVDSNALMSALYYCWQANFRPAREDFISVHLVKISPKNDLTQSERRPQIFIPKRK